MNIRSMSTNREKTQLYYGSVAPRIANVTFSVYKFYNMNLPFKLVL